MGKTKKTIYVFKTISWSLLLFNILLVRKCSFFVIVPEANAAHETIILKIEEIN